MIPFDQARRNMVDSQIRTTDVTSYKVLDAFLKVPREKFVPESQVAFAYSDADIRVSPTRVMTQPSSLARMMQLADIKPDDLVLIIGSGSGYTAAIASKLSNTVVAVESDEKLAANAEAAISALGYDNVAVIWADVKEGVPSEGPYDVIFINGVVEEVPQALLMQLKDGGALVTAKGNDHMAEAIRILRVGDSFSSLSAFDTNAPMLEEFHKSQGFQF
ncbi:protein-L-isoaspartate O-methyltransferase [uncultured Cohaesibacter sp.]|uniref:protein-L-isoaspartate O-methyltransferase family protein n=1 Tax=uncultured Cohaesibacter sp. TaxID=1002546 RepID=UPI0029C917B1|nr:protein-L-isoaspartate O-methyltransferase [uncultured Cohaesibacter sp.]